MKLSAQELLNKYSKSSSHPIEVRRISMMIFDEANEKIREMSNKEVIDYMNAVSNQIDRSKSTLSQIKDVNLTQVNNTVNVNIDNKETSLSRESREKVIDFIKDILKNSQEDSTISKNTSDVIDADIVVEGEKEDNEN